MTKTLTEQILEDYRRVGLDWPTPDEKLIEVDAEEFLDWLGSEGIRDRDYD